MHMLSEGPSVEELISKHFYMSKRTSKGNYSSHVIMIPWLIIINGLSLSLL